MPDHSVRQKLVKQVLPYLVAVSNLKKQWFYLFTRFLLFNRLCRRLSLNITAAI